MQNEILNCNYKGQCGGCSWGHLSHSDQLTAKLEPIRERFPSAKIEWQPFERVRDRVDLVWQQADDNSMKLGLYGLNDPQVVDLQGCPMMSEPLESWFKDFRQRAPQIKRGSVRLRVAPDGARGVWLDFANQDVKTLFEERTYLTWLSQQAFVEIGQRRKALTLVNGQPKLVDPDLRPWFETYDADDKPIPLFGPVGGFSQVGFASNRALVRLVSELAVNEKVEQWLELFCGNGNFALALGSRGLTVEAIELEPLAVAGLKRSLMQAPLSWRNNVRVSQLDVYLKTSQLPELSQTGLVVDPPRAGLRQLLKHMESGWLPKTMIYVSCFTESFLQDADRLSELGYELKSISGVDQFPFSPHSEWVALFRKS